MVEVDFRDTLQGVQAMYAVRACIAEDALTRAPGGAHFAIKEALVATGDDATVRVLDRDGQVISQHVGSHEVCGYARLAGAFLASINRFSTAEDK